jgi:hypothetical protein
MKQKDGGGCIRKLSGRIIINNFRIVPSAEDDAVGSRLFGFHPAYASDEDDTKNDENVVTDIGDTTQDRVAMPHAATLDGMTDIIGIQRSSIARETYIHKYKQPKE